MKRYKVAKPTEIPNENGTWSSIEVDIMDSLAEKADDIFIGSYIRNYPTLYKTFYPFEKDGKWYALYSREYTATRVMSLPDCVDLGGEEHRAFGFCPVDYYVPYQEDPKVAFVAGCVWGDDSSWKIQVLDISDCENGKISRLNLIPDAEYKDGDLENQIFYDEHTRSIEYPTISTYDMKEIEDVQGKEFS